MCPTTARRGRGLLWAALAAVALPATSAAAAVELSLAFDGERAERVETRYACSDGLSRDVAYVNAGPVHLAIVPASPDETLVFANVLSASGARYVAGAWEWWSRGQTATLRDLTAGEDALAVECDAEAT